MIEVETVRHGAGWFRLPRRGLIAVRGEDRGRFLNGQLSQDIAALEALGPGAGGYAFLLTPQGRIVTDVHVAVWSEEIWLECDRTRIPAAIERLDRFLVADDVSLHDESEAMTRFGVEGPRAPALFPECEALEDGHFAQVRIGDIDMWVGAFGWTAFPARQLVVPAAAAPEVEIQILDRGLRHGMVPAKEEVLESLRVEAGVPGVRELDEEVLPAETGALDRAVSFEKGCYTGQEVVARMASRDRMAHRLVGLRAAAGGAHFEVGQELRAGERKVGEVSSATVSSRFGPIALAFVRTAHSEAGTTLACTGEPAEVTVCGLPFGVGGDAGA